MSKRNHFEEINETISVGLRNKERMFRKYPGRLFRDGPRFAKSTVVEADTDNEPRLCIEGFGLAFDTPIANKLGEIIIFSPTSFDGYFSSGRRPEMWLAHDKAKVVGSNVELCILNEGIAFRFPLPTTAHGATVKDMVLSGEHTSISIGFTELRAHDEVHCGHKVRHIDEASIREISVVSVGACKTAFVRLIDENNEPPLHESVNTAMFGLEHDLHNVKRLKDDNDSDIRWLKRSLALLEGDLHCGDEPFAQPTMSAYAGNNFVTEQYDSLRAQRRAVLGM